MVDLSGLGAMLAGGAAVVSVFWTGRKTRRIEKDLGSHPKDRRRPLRDEVREESRRREADHARMWESISGMKDDVGEMRADVQEVRQDVIDMAVVLGDHVRMTNGHGRRL